MYICTQGTRYRCCVCCWTFTDILK